MKTRSMVSFDWAMKRLLRNKANFEVLEGFLSELLRRKIKIKSIGESESNKTIEKNKLNRVDILVESDDEELLVIEIMQGIDKARTLLSYENLTAEEKIEHDALLEEQRNRESEILTSFTDGEFKGRIEGEAIGLEKGEAIGLEKGEAEREKLKAEKEELKAEKEKERAEKEKLKTELDKNNENVVINSHKTGLSPEIISTITELSVEEINRILNSYLKY